MLSHVRLFCDPMDCSLSVHGICPWIFHGVFLCPWDFPGKNTGGGCHFLIQRILPTPESNTCLLHWQMDFLPLSHLGSLLSYTIHKKQLKMDLRLECKTWNHKTPRRRIHRHYTYVCQHCLDIGLSNIFLAKSPQSRETKANFKNWILRRFWMAKETINKMNRQATEWKKIFANDISNKANIYIQNI